jgi:MFS transporter, PPP family, 3-phenylpropionic acid transporter
MVTSRGLGKLGHRTRGALFYFGFYAAQGAYIPFLSVYYAHKNLSGSEIGLLAAIGPLVSLLVAPGLSALADRHAWRVRMLCLGLAATAFTLLLVPVPDSFVGLLLVIAVMSVVASPLTSVADGLLARTASHRGLSFGKMRLWGSVSWALVAAIGGALWENIGFFLMFPLACLLFLATVPIASLLEEDRSVEAHSRPQLRVLMSDGRLRVILAATMMLGLAMSMGMPFSSVYLDTLGGQSLVGLFAGVTAMTELPVMHWSEPILRRFGGPRTLVLAFAFFGVSYLGIAFVQSPVLLLGVAVLQGLGFGLFLPTAVRLVADWTPAHWSSTAQGVLNAGIWGLAPLVAGPLGGILYDFVGPPAVFVACTAASVIAALVMVVAQVAGVFNPRYEHGEATITPPAGT